MPVASAHSPSTKARAKRVRSIRSLRRGDIVEARSGGTIYFHGEVQDTAPGLSTVWIRDESTGQRTAASMDDFTLWKL
ncbi:MULTISPECIES: hypothetical protein [Arthrobacter]|uniref:DUF1918 domain-containing protein n=1 Tax=Arthrobacter jinronghuae TaxID=2964609 RepID=A0ABT1NMM4_9MICC|nr:MULTISPECIES: hypothetical protein [Arthrobacter]MCQ1948900.1 hypothetical protein [Arthrobacter jinronghuae]MCQ1952225.1 hypothetical protein [Arthrobacter sp. zg-Y238]UWX78296.1 hypothetical protein N2K98_15240 [Arthrobacter jinronghuae]